VATVVVSHDLDAAPRLADRLVVLDRGRLLSDGSMVDLQMAAGVGGTGGLAP
jgi:ABC-type sulfate/molybdate transport systems ATPase subunit